MAGSTESHSAFRTIVIAFMLLGIPGASSGASESDCGGAGDAGDTFGTARSVTAPFVACPGHLDATDREDWYAIESVAGGRITLVLDTPEGNTKAYACIWTPTGARHDCGDWHAFGAPTPSGGVWRVQVFVTPTSNPAPVSGYVLSVATQELHYEGRFLVPHEATRVLPEGGINGLLGPDSGLDGIDGSWVTLPTLSGGEWIHSRDFPGIDLRFYDADHSKVGECIHVNSVMDPCAVPLDARRALVTDASGILGVSWPNAEWSFELVH